MVITENVRERFCEEYSIPLDIYREPYFSERLDLYATCYETEKSWRDFIEGISGYNDINDYIEEFNWARDAAIYNIKETSEYKEFYNLFNPKYASLIGQVYTEENNFKYFIGINFEDAYFYAMHRYSASMFRDSSGIANTWEEYISKFTDNAHMIKSRYMMHSVLQSCAAPIHLFPIISDIITKLKEREVIKDEEILLTGNELTIDVNKMTNSERKDVLSAINSIIDDLGLPVKVELFELHKLSGSAGYFKEVFVEGHRELRLIGVESYLVPFAIRGIKMELPEPEDDFFMLKGKLAKFIETPYVSIML